jgi:hypothetical protein
MAAATDSGVTAVKASKLVKPIRLRPLARHAVSAHSPTAGQRRAPCLAAFSE